MRIQLFVFGIAVSSLLAGTTHGDEMTPQINVMSFNVRYNNPADGPDAWPHRAEWVAEIMGKQSDIAGLQEVRKEQLEDLKKSLPDFEFYGVGREDGKEGGEYVPVAWKADRFTALDQGYFWLSETPDEPSKSWDSSLKRITTWVRLRESATKKSFLFVNTHFDHRGAVARAKSGELIHQWITKHRGDDPVLLTGDFNTLPDSEPYQLLLAGGDPLVDARLAVENPQGPASTWNGFKEIVPGRRIDFIFATGPLKLTHFQTIDEQRDGRFPSDHCPIVARVQLGDE